jgi:hypothetical protein
MPATFQQLHEFLTSPDWTYGEKMIIRWQFRMLGDFETPLLEAIALADAGNLMSLRMGFPEIVDAYLAWTVGPLGDRFRAAGLQL